MVAIGFSDFVGMKYVDYKGQALIFIAFYESSLKYVSAFNIYPRKETLHSKLGS